jgi:hypothetical protein
MLDFNNIGGTPAFTSVVEPSLSNVAPTSTSALFSSSSLGLMLGSSSARKVRSPAPQAVREHATVYAKNVEQLANKAFDLKATAGQFTVHLNSAWRAGLFNTIDTILNEDHWELSDKLPVDASFMTFLRLAVYMKGLRRPGLGVTHEGNVVAVWVKNKDRLSIECLPNDFARWSIAWTINGERESTAGKTNVRRLPAVLAAYEPGFWIA